MYRVLKRNGQVVDFSLSKICAAMTRAFEATGRQYNDNMIEKLALRVTADYEAKIRDDVVTIEDIQDSVETILIRAGYEDVAKAYILYRKQHENIRKMKATMLDYKKLVDKYVNETDWRVKENSTVTYSVGGLILSNSGAITANYWLSEVYDPEIAEAHRNADIHLHDLSMLTGYCFTGDTRIKTLDGNNYSFAEMVAKGIKNVWVYAYDRENNKIVPALAVNPRVTRSVNKLVKVTLCNKREIVSTTDHLYMKRNGDFVAASDLKPNVSLMPLYISERGKYVGISTNFAYVESADVQHKAYNHAVRKVETITLDQPIDVYDITVPLYENFALDAGVFVHNCAGWSLRQLIQEGLGGIPGKITSSPAKHLATLCNQMVNFLGIMQNEWAGAQAFSSFDTYLAPFVRTDNLSYEAVKKCIESFVYGVNTPSRWGCVPITTEVLSTTGFKKYDELQEGDLIYTFKDGKLQINPVRKVIVKPFKGELHSYVGRNYVQTVTPNHRVLVRKYNSKNCCIKQSDEIIDDKNILLPTMFDSSADSDANISDDDIKLAAIVYADGSFDFRKGRIHKISIYKSPKRGGNDIIRETAAAGNYVFTLKEKTGFGVVNQYTFFGESARKLALLTGNKNKVHKRFFNLSARQAKLFLKTWALCDGDEEKMLIQCDNEDIADGIQRIALLAGYTSYRRTKNKTLYIKIRKSYSVHPTSHEKIDYDGLVWCPNVENGTAVFRENGSVFISGQTQAPFSNITLDWTVPPDLANQKAIVGGKEMDFTYGDCQPEMDIINRAFIEIMLEGDAEGRGFQYPIPTYSITKEFDWSDTLNNRLLFEMTAKYGTPYFSNYVNSDMQPSDIRALCCRLRLSLRELRKKSGGYFGSGESTGSVGVVTINMPRIAYLAKDEADFYKRLDHLMDLAARSLKIKRKVITKLLDEGLYPYTKHYLGAFNNHFSTIGLVGMNEVGLNANWLGGDMTTPQTQKFTKEVLNHMRERLADYQEQYGDLYNLEASPVESTSYRLALHDKEQFPDIKTASEKTPYYTNSSHLPVGCTDDIFEALDAQDELQTLYTSGTVFHAFLGEKLSGWKSAANLVRKIAENYRLPYYTLSPTYSVCRQHGYLAGEVKRCPHCGEVTEVYSRITGYYRPVGNWNDGKAQEFKDRTTYQVENDIPPLSDSAAAKDFARLETGYESPTCDQ